MKKQVEKKNIYEIVHEKSSIFDYKLVVIFCVFIVPLIDGFILYKLYLDIFRGNKYVNVATSIATIVAIDLLPALLIVMYRKKQVELDYISLKSIIGSMVLVIAFILVLMFVRFDYVDHINAEEINAGDNYNNAREIVLSKDDKNSQVKMTYVSSLIYILLPICSSVFGCIVVYFSSNFRGKILQKLKLKKDYLEKQLADNNSERAKYSEIKDNYKEKIHSIENGRYNAKKKYYLLKEDEFKSYFRIELMKFLSNPASISELSQRFNTVNVDVYDANFKYEMEETSE